MNAFLALMMVAAVATAGCAGAPETASSPSMTGAATTSGPATATDAGPAHGFAVAEQHNLLLTAARAGGTTTVQQGPNCVTVVPAEGGTLIQVSGNLTWDSTAAPAGLRLLLIIPDDGRVLYIASGTVSPLRAQASGEPLVGAPRVTFVAEPLDGAVANLAMTLDLVATGTQATPTTGEATCST